jgi:aminoglycoside/choline kinase family phosphotransferase
VPFDLASLLEDVRRRCRRPSKRHGESLSQGNPDIKAADFGRPMRSHRRSATHINACQLLKRDGKPNYQRFIPRVWELLRDGYSSGDGRSETLVR